MDHGNGRSKEERLPDREYPGSGDYEYLFTVLIPTYNRARLVKRAVSSLREQGTDDLECLVVDDGSTDDTGKVVEELRHAMPFPIRYFRQENKGKPWAWNFALDKIRGYFTVVLDSDDVLAKNALAAMDRMWLEIPLEQRPGFAGIEGLVADLESGETLGDPFPFSPMDSTYPEIQYLYGVCGDKKGMIRTDVMKEFPFPVFEGEKDMREGVVFARMSRKYRFRYVNEVFQLVEQLPDGLTARCRERRMGSPKGFRLAFMELLNHDWKYLSRKAAYRNMVRYIRYSYRAGLGPMRQARDIRHKLFWGLALPEGTLSAAWDYLRGFLKRHG